MSEALKTNDVPAFDMSGGNLCLDFANTLDNRVTERPLELLTSYRNLAAWGEQAQIVSSEEAEQLLEKAVHQPHKAEAVLQQAVVIREAIYRIFASLTREETPAGADVAQLNGALASALSHLLIMQHEQHFEWDWAFEPDALDYVIWPVVRAAADLLTTDSLPMVRMCSV